MKTVLVVDDEFTITEALSDLLADEGYRTVLAFNGQEGLLRVGEAHPDLVIVDMMMPVMAGAEMIRALRSQPLTKDLPIIAMSALGEPPEGPQLGYQQFLSKPFEIDHLLNAVRRLVGFAERGS